MKVQEMIELLMLQSPIDNGNIAEVYLKNALKEFCESSRLVKKTTVFEIPVKDLEQDIDIENLISIRDIYNSEGVKLDATALPSYLQANNGYWYVKTSGSGAPVVEIGYWNGSGRSSFDAGAEFFIEYDAYVDLVPLTLDEKDYTKEPPIDARWHDVVLARACEKANFSNPNLRRYYYANWSDGLRKAKQAAREMSTNSTFNMKVFDL